MAFQPEPAATRRAEPLLWAFFAQAQRIESRYHAAVSFIDAGENPLGTELKAIHALI